MAVVSMSYLLEAGVHFGHQTKRWNPKMKEYIYTSRDDIYIIDLQKTAKKIELTERNVLLKFKECLDASKQPINGVDLFVPGAKQKPAVLYIDRKKVIPHCDEIYYMLGQYFTRQRKKIKVQTTMNKIPIISFCSAGPRPPHRP